jgi:hypothetical protein
MKYIVWNGISHLLILCGPPEQPFLGVQTAFFIMIVSSFNEMQETVPHFCQGRWSVDWDLNL